jgi:hypothetical protein
MNKRQLIFALLILLNIFAFAATWEQTDCAAPMPCRDTATIGEQAERLIPLPALLIGMLGKSYVGETQEAECPECGYTAEIRCDDFQQMKIRPYSGHPYSGYCTGCDSFVEWEQSED